MKVFAKFLKGLPCFLLGLMTYGTVSAQNALPVVSDFESGTEGWTLKNGTAVNKWVRGNQAAGNDGYCLYISKDDGATNEYELTSASVAHAYIYATIPAEGATLKFSYRVAGELDEDEDEGDTYYDYLGVSVLDEAPTDDAMPGVRWEYADRSTWQTVSLSLTASMSGNKYIVFTWKNDGSGGTNPAVAIDDVVLMPFVAKPGDPKFSNQTSNSLTVSWTASTTSGVKYRVQEAKGTNGASAPWTTVAEDLTVTTLDRTGLDEYTNYYYRIQAYIDENVYSDYTGNYTGTRTLYACPAPTGLAYTVSSGDYVFTWVSDASAFQFEWKEASAAEWTKVEGLPAATYTLPSSSLQEATAYKFRVKAVCNPQDKEVYTDSMMFSTPCPAQTLPYSEDFNVWTGKQLTCWTIVDANNDNRTWEPSSYDGIGSTYCAKCSYSASSGPDVNDWLISPAIALARAATLSFKIKTGSSDEEKYSVLLSTTGMDVADFTMVLVDETPIKNPEWSAVTVSLDNAEWIGKNIYIAIKACSEKFKGNLYIDDFTVVTCGAPTLTFADLTASSAKVHIASSAEKFTLQYRKEGDENWTELQNQTAEVPLTGLSEGSTYEVRAKAYCSDDDESLYSDVFSLNTPYAPRPFPLEEDFAGVENGQVPTAWDMRDSKNATWSVKSNYAGKYLAFNSYNGRYSNICTPIIDLTNADRDRLEIAFTYSNTYSSGVFFKVSYSIDNGLTWTELKNEAGGYFQETSKTTVTIPMKEKVGDAATLMMRFEGIGGYMSGDVCLYEVKIHNGPVCFPPTDVQVVDEELAANQAKLTWSAPTSGSETPQTYAIRYWADQSTDTTKWTSTDATTSATINPLVQNTTYYLLLKSNCQTESSSEVALNFTTPYSCPAITDLAVKTLKSDEATVEFNAEHTGNVFEIEYRPLNLSKDEPIVWTSFNKEYAQTEFTLTELNPNTPYRVRVRVICSDDDNSLWDSLTFKTPCVASELPWAEDFEGELTDKLPDCWTYAKIAGTSSSQQWTVENDEHQSGAKSLRYYSYMLQNGNMAVMASPALNFDKDMSYSLSFWVKRNGTSEKGEGIKVFVNNRMDTVGGRLLAYISNNKNDNSVPSVAGENGWNRYEFPLDNLDGVNHVVFCGIAKYDQNIFVDNVKIDPVYPYNLAIKEVGEILPRANLNQENISVSIVNLGVSEYTGELEFTMQVDEAEPVSEVVVLTDENYLMGDSGNVYTYTFKAKADLSASGKHTVRVSVAMEDDPDVSDNTDSIETERYDALQMPYQTKFAATESDWFRIVDSNGDGKTWTLAEEDMAARIVGSADTSSNDMLYTPGIHITPGVYEIGLKYAALAADANDSLSLTAVSDYEEDGISVMNLKVASEVPAMETAIVEIVDEDAYMMKLHALGAKGQLGIEVDSLYIKLKYVLRPIEEILCEGSTYMFGDKELSEPGIYTDTIKVSDNVDTIVYLKLEQAERYTFALDTAICEGEQIVFGGKTYTEPGTYTETYPTVSGCDSIYTLTLSINSTYSFALDTTICEGEQIVFGGKTYTEPGTYTETYPTVSGCDSVYTLTLTVNPLPQAPVIHREDNAGKIDLVAETDASSVQWYNAIGSIKDATALRYTVTENGIYHATVSNTCGESAPSNTIEVKNVGNNRVEETGTFALYPNPAETEVTIRSQQGNIREVRVVSAEGRLMLHKTGIQSTEAVISVRKYRSGIYMVQITTETGVHTSKLVVR